MDVTNFFADPDDPNFAQADTEHGSPPKTIPRRPKTQSNENYQSHPAMVRG